MRRRRAGIERVDIGSPLLQVPRGAGRAGRDRRRYRRQRGRTNRFRTSPRAGRAAGCASRRRTSCPKHARRLAWSRSLTHPGDSARRRSAAGRDAAMRRSGRQEASSPRPREPKDARVSLSGSRVRRSRVSRCASVLMTETSRPSRQSLIDAAKPSLSLRSPSVRAASLCRQSSSAGVACSLPRPRPCCRSRQARLAEYRRG